jgi:hypothetical protein
VEEITLTEAEMASPAESPAVPMEINLEEASESSEQIQPPDETAAPIGGELSSAAKEVHDSSVATAATGELYNVFLSKITEVSKRDKAAELIAKIKGCSTNEAKELTTRLVIPLAKNVTKEQADDVLNQFKRLKIFGRMTKVK